MIIISDVATDINSKLINFTGDGRTECNNIIMIIFFYLFINYNIKIVASVSIWLDNHNKCATFALKKLFAKLSTLWNKLLKLFVISTANVKQ